MLGLALAGVDVVHVVHFMPRPDIKGAYRITVSRSINRKLYTVYAIHSRSFWAANPTTA